MIRYILIPIGIAVLFFSCSRSVSDLSRGFPDHPELFNPTPEALAGLREKSPGWPHLLGRILQDRGLRASSQAVFRDDARNGRSPWNTLSADSLISLARDQGDWLLLEEAALLAQSIQPDSADYGRTIAEALYRQERFQDLLEHLSAIPRSEESLLWYAVAKRETGDADWKRGFLDAFTAFPASDVHRRLYLYLYYRGDLEEFSETERLILAVPYRAALGETAEARRLLRRASIEDLSALVPAGFDSGSGFAATVEQVFASGSPQDALNGIAWFSGSGDVSPVLLEAAQRYDDAQEAFFDRGDWVGTFRCAVLAERSVSQALAPVLSIVPDDERLDELVGPEVSRLVRSRDVEELRRIGSVLPESQAALRSRIQLIRYFFGDDVVFDAYRRLPAGNYYRTWTDYVIGTPIELSDETQPDRHVETPDPEGTAALAGELLSLGLTGEAYRVVRGAMRAETIAPETVAEIAPIFVQDGAYFEGITLLRIALSIESRGPRPDEVAILYPRLFPGEFSAVSDEGGFSPALLYGLVREESHFLNTAVSHADAHGLSQVLEGTAEDMARRIGLAEYDLYNVTDNLRLGGAYLKFLFDRLSVPVHVLAGYNAGYGRLREWVDEFGDLPPFLFVEAIPYVETRGYVRKVVSSALYYEQESTPSRYLEYLFGMGEE